MKYALKALIHIANHQETDGYVKAHDIAEQAQIPKKFLEQILLDLKKGRIINSKQGNVGGCDRPAENPHGFRTEQGASKVFGMAAQGARLHRLLGGLAFAPGVMPADRPCPQPARRITTAPQVQSPDTGHPSQ